MKKNKAPRILTVLNGGVFRASLLWAGGAILPRIFIDNARTRRIFTKQYQA
jgi:hypothetical protein